MPESYAEVIGDPIAHSKSPLIHGFWLDALGIAGAYGRTRVTPATLSDYLATRREDPDWRGCNVTAPLKKSVIPLLREMSEGARAVGAVNCILPRDGELVGLNTDVDGIAQALAAAPLGGAKVAIIGGGGAARAAIHHLVREGAAHIAVLVRNPARADALTGLGPRGTIRIVPISEASTAIDGAGAVINASPLGMAHAPAMPASLLAALDRLASGAIAMDMVYDPVETALLVRARAASIPTVDGLIMLVGQARKAFTCFFGVAPPASGDAELRKRLLGIKPVDGMRQRTIDSAR